LLFAFGVFSSDTGGGVVVLAGVISSAVSAFGTGVVGVGGLSADFAASAFGTGVTGVDGSSAAFVTGVVVMDGSSAFSAATIFAAGVVGVDGSSTFTTSLTGVAGSENALGVVSVCCFTSSPVFFSRSPNDFCPPASAAKPPPVLDANALKPPVEDAGKADRGVVLGGVGIELLETETASLISTGEGDRLSGTARGESTKTGFGASGFVA